MESNSDNPQATASFTKIQLYVQAIDDDIPYTNAKPRYAWLALGMHIYWKYCSYSQPESAPSRLRDFRFHNRLLLQRLNLNCQEEDLTECVTNKMINKQSAVVVKGHLIPGRIFDRDGVHFLRVLLSGLCPKSVPKKQGLVQLVIICNSPVQSVCLAREIQKRLVPWKYIARSVENLTLMRRNIDPDIVEHNSQLDVARSELKSTLDIDLRQTVSLKLTIAHPSSDVEVGEANEHNTMEATQNTRQMSRDVSRKNLKPLPVHSFCEELELLLKCLGTILALVGSTMALVLRGKPGFNFPYLETLIGVLALYQIAVIFARFFSMRYEIRRGIRNFKGLIPRIKLFHDELLSTLCSILYSSSEVDAFQYRNALEVREETLKLGGKMEMFLMRADSSEYYEVAGGGTSLRGVFNGLTRAKWNQFASSWKDVTEVESAIMVLQDKVALVSQLKLILKSNQVIARAVQSRNTQ